MATEKKKTLPWLIPGMRRPNYQLQVPRFTLSIKIPLSLFYILAHFVVFYIFSGAVYNSVALNVRPYGVRPDGTIQLIQWDGGDISDQYEWEGFVAALLIYVGTLGFYLLKKGSEEPHNINRALTYQTIAIILLFVAFVSVQLMFNYKASKKPPW